MYYRMRYYDPGIGRFITADPIRFQGGINFYTYVLNNPVNLVDPTGEWLLPAIAVGTGAVAAATFAYQAYKAAKKADEARTIRDKVYDEIGKGVPDPEFAEKLKEDADKAEKEFLKELMETVKKGAACAY